MSNKQASSDHSLTIFVPEAFSQAANRLRLALANAIASVPQAHCDETLGSKLDRREIDDAASACFDVIAGSPATGDMRVTGLKPCPFCNAPAERKPDPGVCGVPFGLVVEHLPECFLSPVWRVNDDDVDTAWNTRAIPPIGAVYDVEAIAAGHAVLEGRGDGTYAEAEAAIRLLIAVASHRTAGDVQKAVRAMATADGLDFDEVCGFDTDAEECNSGTCVAAGYEDHDPAWAREVYLRRAKAVVAAMQPRSEEPVPDRHELVSKAIEDAEKIAERIRAGGYRASIANVETLLKHVRKLAEAAPAEPATNPCKLPADVARLVVAGRIVWERIAFDALPDADETNELDRALEAFSARVPYEDEPDDFAETAKSAEPASGAGEHPNAMDWRNRAERAEAECAELRGDKARLDYLDRCNAALNAHYGTSYRWKMIQSHNVNRLMLGHWQVDLHDNEASGLPSCRAAIDERMREAKA